VGQGRVGVLRRRHYTSGGLYRPSAGARPRLERMRWTLRATLGALLGAWLVIGQAQRHELAERFLFITGVTASTEA